MRAIDIETKSIRTADGADIAYCTSAGDGPWVLLLNGFGFGLHAWRHQIDYLRGRVRFLTWDYRGLSVQGAANTSPAALPLHRHARDAASILEAEGVSQSVWMGCSTGAQILFECLRTLEHRPTHIVLMNATFGRDTAGGRDWLGRRLGSQGLRLLAERHNFFESVARRTAQWPETVSWLKRLGFVGPTVDEQSLAEVFASVAQVDMKVMFETLRDLRNQEVRSVLERIVAPTLVVVGERDRFIRRSTAERMARRIAGSEVFVIRGATHFAALEFPELLNLRIEKFLRERGVL